MDDDGPNDPMPEHEATPEGRLPDHAPLASVLRTRPLTARLAEGGRFAEGLGQTLSRGPAPVLGRIASTSFEPLLTVQSKLPPSRPAVASPPTALLRPAAAEPLTRAPADARGADHDGGLLRGLARFVFRRLRPRGHDEAAEAPSSRPAPPAPPAATAREAVSPPVIGAAPGSQEPPSRQEEPDEAGEAPETTGAAPPETTPAGSFGAPTYEPETAHGAPATLVQVARRPRQQALQEATPAKPAEGASAEEAAEPVFATTREASAARETAPTAAAARAGSSAPAAAPPAAAPSLARRPAPEAAADTLPARRNEPREEEVRAPASREAARNAFGSLAVAIRRIVRRLPEAPAPQPSESAAGSTEAAQPSPVIARSAEGAPPLSDAADALAGEDSASLSRLAVLRHAAEVPSAAPAPAVQAPAAPEAIAQELPGADPWERSSLVHRVAAFLRPGPSVQPPPEQAAGAVIHRLAEARRVTAEATATGPQADGSRKDIITPQSAVLAPGLSPLAVARSQLPPPATARPPDHQEEASDAAAPAGPDGALVLHMPESPHRAWDAGLSPEATPIASPRALAAVPAQLRREVAPALVYRRSAFAAAPGSALPADGSSVDGFEAANGGIEAVLRRAERGSSRPATIAAPASIVQRQLGDEAAVAGASETAPAVDAVAATTGAAGGEAAAVPPAEAVAGLPNQALDRLAREIYDRLRRRLMLERERAGLGQALT